MHNAVLASRNVPAMQTTIDSSLTDVYVSPSNRQDNPKVNRLDVEDRMVLDVTFVMDKLKLKVS